MTVETHTGNAKPLHTAQSVATEYEPLVARVCDTLNTQLTRLYEDMIHGATARLVSLDSDANGYAPQPATGQEIHEREGIRYLLRDTYQIRQQFLENIKAQLEPGAADAETAAIEEPSDELSLVSHDEMEEMVAITTMNANALNEFGEVISDLNARIESLASKRAPIFDAEAISPKSISEAYRKTLHQLNNGTGVNLVLLKLFNEQVNQNLGNLYGSINQILIDAGVEAAVVHASRASKTNDHGKAVAEETLSALGETVEYYDKPENANSYFKPRSQAELYDIVSQFTRGDISVTGNELDMPVADVTGTGGPAPGSPMSKLPASFYKDPSKQNINSKIFYQRKDVVQSLDRLQRRLLEQGSNSGLNTTEEIKRSLLDDIGNANPDGTAREVTVLHERNIDFVGLMFDAIAADHSISDVVNKLLSMLHIPVIKVALEDEELFRDESHPTRKVLNLIPRAGLGVTNTDDKLYWKIESVVKDILAEHDVDIESFYRAVEALHKIIQMEEETAKTTEQEEKRNIIKEHGRAVVVNELRRLSLGKTIPEEVRPLILKHISTMLLNIYIQHGSESMQWSHATGLCKLLIDLLQPIRDKAQWNLFRDNYFAIGEVVHDELQNTRQDKASINIQVLTLKSTLIKMKNEYEHFEKAQELRKQQAIPYAVQKQMDEYDAEMARARAQKESVVDKVARLPTYVKPGAWFEIHTGDDSPVRRLKMSVILLETAEIVFVDRKGKRGLARDAGEFAEELASGQSRLLDDNATFDKALGKVISMMAA